jgi:hypothetical protein
MTCAKNRYVEEAERVFETRVQACQQRGEDHLHVYVSEPSFANNFPKPFQIPSQIRSQPPLANPAPYLFLISRIVGKGIHSLNHLQKLRPAIEKLCQQQQFKYFVEENEGRILVKFGDGAGHLSQGEAQSFWDKLQNFAAPSQSYPGTSQPQQQYQQQQQGGYQHNQGQQGGYNRPNQGGQGGQGNDIVEQVVKKAAPIVFRKLRQCCTIM